MTQRGYARVYLDVPDDPRFADVWADDASLALWLRLLVSAEAAWPIAPALPAGHKPRALKRLIDSGLVELAPGRRFRVHGLASERARRSAHGSAGAHARWGGNASAMRAQSERNATAMPAQSDRNAKPIGRGLENQVSNPAKPGARAPRARGSATQENQPRLTAAQLRAWDPYTAKAWRPFQQAWLERGFKRPPTGGDEGQAQLLWQIADARSDDLGIWVAEAPRGATSQEVVGYVLERWHAIRREVEQAEVEQERQRRRTPPERAGDVLARLGLAASRREEGSA